MCRETRVATQTLLHACQPRLHPAFTPSTLPTRPLQPYKTKTEYHAVHINATKFKHVRTEQRIILILMWHHCVRENWCHVFYYSFGVTLLRCTRLCIACVWYIDLFFRGKRYPEKENNKWISSQATNILLK